RDAFILWSSLCYHGRKLFWFPMVSLALPIVPWSETVLVPYGHSGFTHCTMVGNCFGTLWTLWLYPWYHGRKLFWYPMDTLALPMVPWSETVLVPYGHSGFTHGTMIGNFFSTLCTACLYPSYHDHKLLSSPMS